MKKRLLLLALFLCNSFVLFAQGEDCAIAAGLSYPPKDNQVYDWCFTNGYGTNWDTNGFKPYIINGMRFRLLYPKNYDPAAAKTYPLVIQLHGIGEYGKDNNYQLSQGADLHLKAWKENRYDGFVMLPQSNYQIFATWEQDAVMKFIEYSLKNLKVDPFKVQIEGISAGGAVAWKMANKYPLVFAALTPFSASDGSNEAMAENLKYTAIWHTQGGKDKSPTPAAGNRVAEAFQKVGANYQYKYYADLGHGTWKTSFRDSNFFKFLQNNSMLNIHALYFDYNLCEGEPSNGTLGVKQGFLSYNWKKDGQPIMGAHNNEIRFTSAGSYQVQIQYKDVWGSVVWSEWSKPLEIKEIAPTATPTIEASGSTVLPTPDGKTTVTLRAPKGYQDYLWSDGSTLDSLVVSKEGSYSVSVTEAYGCPSAYSEPIKVTYNSSTNDITAPTNFAVEAVSVSELNLKWADNSANETGFEIYRSTSSSGPWKFVALVAANTTSYLDKNLTSFTSYYYSLRAVNSNGGSAYAYANGKTKADNTPPTAPTNLEATKTSHNSIGLQWLPSTDNAAGTITYEVYTNDKTTFLGTTTNTYFLARGLEKHRWYNFAVRAVDEVGNKSGFSNQLTAGTFIDGLYFTYYEGEITTVKDMTLLPPVRTGRVPNFDIVSPRLRNDHFAFKFEGYINIKTAGTYTFYTNSNDGSTLSIDGKEVVNNDNLQGATEKSGTIELTAGIHEIKVLYFDFNNSEILQVFWQGPGIKKELIPDSAFKEDITTAETPAAPLSVKAEAIDHKSILLKWTDNSDNETGFEIFRSTSNDGTFSSVGSVGANIGQYTDDNLNPATTYYYKVRAVNNSGASAFAERQPDGNWANATTKELAADNNLPVLKDVGIIYARFETTTTVQISATDKDPRDKDPLTITVSNLPSFATFKDNGDGTASISITPALNDAGTYSNIIIEVKDSFGGSDSETISIVVDENHAPTIMSIRSVNLQENETRTVEVRANDANGDIVTISLADAPGFVSLTDRKNNTGYITIAPGYAHAGEFVVTVKVTDPKGATGITKFELVVRDVKTDFIALVNFNDYIDEQAPAPWNNFALYPSAGTTISNIKDTDLGLTTIDVTVVDDFGRKEGGATTGNNSGVYPDAVLKSHFYGWDGNTRRIKVSGLDPLLTYTFTILGCSNNGINDLAPTEYTIKGISKTLAVKNNTANTVTFSELKAPAGELIIGVKGTQEKQYAFINALVIDSRYVDTNPPMGPSALTATLSASKAAQLTWTDNAYNETGFEVWRGTDGVNFTTKVGTPAADVTSITDNTIVAGTSYYYRARALNQYGASGWSNVAVLEAENPENPNPDNKAPVISGLPALVDALEGTETRIPFGLSDPENDELLLTYRNMPSFAKIVRISDTQAELVLNPTAQDIGLYEGVQLIVSDGTLQTDITFSISIKSSQKNTVYVNFGNSNSLAGRPWNNINYSSKPGNVILLDDLGNATPYKLDNFNGWHKNEAWGESSGNNSGIYPDVVMKSAHIVNASSTTGASFKVKGLKPGYRYNFVFFGSSVYGSKKGATNTTYTVGNETVSLAISSNQDKTVQINGIKGDANGDALITVRGMNDDRQGGYLNALVIEEYQDDAKILRPARLTAHGVSKTQVDLNWTDNSYQETGFEIFRRTLPDGTFTSITTTAKNVTSYSDKGLAANTGYEYRVRAVGNGNSEYSVTAQAATLSYQVYINANKADNYAASSPWNNLSKIPSAGSTWYDFKNEDKNNTGIHLRLDEAFSGTNDFGPDANGKGIYPDQVIKTFYFNEVGVVSKLRFFGLDDNLTYNFRFFASSAFGENNGVTDYRIGSKKVSLDVQYNLNNTAIIRNVQPTNANVTIEVEAGEFARYGYLSAIVIEVRDSFKEIQGANSNNSLTDQQEPAAFKAEEEVNQITTVYPNPTDDRLFIDFAAKTEGKYYLQIIDLRGKLLLTQEVIAQEGANTFSLDLRNPSISSGMYILRIKSMDFESKVIRFMKQ